MKEIWYGNDEWDEMGVIVGMVNGPLMTMRRKGNANAGRRGNMRV